MYIYRTKIFQANIRSAIHTEGDKSEEHLNPSLTDDTSFREALDEQGASHRHLLFGKLN